MHPGMCAAPTVQRHTDAKEIRDSTELEDLGGQPLALYLRALRGLSGGDLGTGSWKDGSPMRMELWLVCAPGDSLPALAAEGVVWDFETDESAWRPRAATVDIRHISTFGATHTSGACLEVVRDRGRRLQLRPLQPGPDGGKTMVPSYRVGPRGPDRPGHADAILQMRVRGLRQRHQPGAGRHRQVQRRADRPLAGAFLPVRDPCRRRRGRRGAGEGDRTSPRRSAPSWTT